MNGTLIVVIRGTFDLLDGVAGALPHEGMFVILGLPQSFQGVAG